MDASVFAATFGIIFLAELGDKTQITAMVLATRHPWQKVFAGLAVAFVVLNLGAVLVGKVLFAVLPLLWIKLASAALFLVFGVMTLRAKDEEDGDEAEKAAKHGPVLTAFLLILAAELGDKTQIVTASLAAQHASQTAVFAGSTLALWAVSLLGILAGKQLTRFVPMRYIKRAAGVIFLAFAAVILYETLGGQA